MYKLNFNKIFVLLFINVMFMACGSDDDNQVSPDEKAMEELVGEWKAVKVTRDDFELAGFENFRLVITPDKVFQTYGDTGLVFPIGEFELAESGNYERVICNDLEVKLNHDNGHLIASFTLTAESSNGRQTGVIGRYVFDMVANQ